MEGPTKDILISFNPIQDGPFRGFSGMAPSLKCHISCNDETWHIYTLSKEDPKNINHLKHPLSSADISIFYQKLAIFVTSINTDIDFILVLNFYFF